MRAHSESERSVWYVFLMNGRVPNYHYRTPTFRTVSKKLSEKVPEQGLSSAFARAGQRK
jgi:hypothetical protein